MARTYRVWTTEDKSELKTMLAQRMPHKEIAAALGRSLNSVEFHARALRAADEEVKTYRPASRKSRQEETDGLRTAMLMSDEAILALYGDLRYTSAQTKSAGTIPPRVMRTAHLLASGASSSMAML